MWLIKGVIRSIQLKTHRLRRVPRVFRTTVELLILPRTDLDRAAQRKPAIFPFPVSLRAQTCDGG